MRRLRTYASGGHFIAPSNSMLFLSHVRFPWTPSRSSLGALRVRLDGPGPLFDARAAQIRVGVLFFVCAKIVTLSFMHGLRTYVPSVDTGRRGDLSLLRRLRRSACAFYFIFVVLK